MPAARQFADKYGLPEKPVKNRCAFCNLELMAGKRTHVWCWTRFKRQEQRAAKK